MNESGFAQIGAENLIGHPPVDNDILRIQPFEHHGKPRGEGVPQFVPVLFARHYAPVGAYGNDVIARNAEEAIIISRGVSPSDTWYREHAVLLQIEADRPGEIDLSLVDCLRPADRYRRIRAYEPTATSEISDMPLRLGYQTRESEIVDKAMKEHVFIFDALARRIRRKSLRDEYIIEPKHARDVRGAVKDRPFDQIILEVVVHLHLFHKTTSIQIWMKQITLEQVGNPPLHEQL